MLSSIHQFALNLLKYLHTSLAKHSKITRKMETKVTSEPKSNGVKKGGARIIVDNDDEDLRYGLKHP